MFQYRTLTTYNQEIQSSFSLVLTKSVQIQITTVQPISASASAGVALVMLSPDAAHSGDILTGSSLNYIVSCLSYCCISSGKFRENDGCN